jgi:hypothetical protein
MMTTNDRAVEQATIDAAEIERLEKLRAAATPGPWQANGRDIVLPDRALAPWSKDEPKNVRLIVTAINALPSLLATIRDLQAKLAEAERILANPPKHKFWRAGELNCPREIKAGNGELHTLRCKVCGQDSPRNDICTATLTSIRKGGE